MSDKNRNFKKLLATVCGVAVTLGGSSASAKVNKGVVVAGSVFVLSGLATLTWYLLDKSQKKKPDEMPDGQRPGEKPDEMPDGQKPGEKPDEKKPDGKKPDEKKLDEKKLKTVEKGKEGAEFDAFQATLQCYDMY